MTLYNHDSHLAEEDEQLFDHHPRGWRKKSERAAEDLTRDLKRRGFLEDDAHTFADDFQKATATVAFTASGDGPLAVPAGARVVALDPELGLGLADIPAPAQLVFLADEELTVAAGETATVGVTAEHPGTPHNVGAGWLTALEEEPTNLASVTNSAPATGGVDHQRTLG